MIAKEDLSKIIKINSLAILSSGNAMSLGHILFNMFEIGPDWIQSELLNSNDILVLWNYPGYNLSDFGTSSLSKIKKSHRNLILSIRA